MNFINLAYMYYHILDEKTLIMPVKFAPSKRIRVSQKMRIITSSSRNTDEPLVGMACYLITSV